MGSIQKVIGVLSCSFLLSLGLSTIASSANQVNRGQSDGQLFVVGDKETFVAGKEVKGEIVKIDG